MARPVNRMRPVHPGEVLREDYLAPLALSVNAFLLRWVFQQLAFTRSSKSAAP